MGLGKNLPNLVTIARMACCPAIFILALDQSLDAKIWAAALFLFAGMSDLWDGYLARKYGWITDTGKLLDPLADKLLLVATFIPFYIISHRGTEVSAIPYWGGLPMWVMVLILGREIFVTMFRQWATRRKVVIAAGISGKYKAFLQNSFSGGLLLWYPLQDISLTRDLSAWYYRVWIEFHSMWIGLTLALALLFTVYSMLDYLWSYRNLIGVKESDSI